MRSLTLILLLCTGCRCKEAAEKHVGSSWFEVSLPAGFEEMPFETDAQRDAVTKAWTLPRGADTVRFIVARPVLFSGDANEYLDSQRAGIGFLGLTVADPRDAELGGVKARMLEGTHPRATMRWWFFAKDGLAGAVQCGGGASNPDKTWLVCDQVVKSFRFVGKIPAPPISAVTTLPPHELTLGGFTFQAPGDWVSFAPLPAGAKLQLRSERMVGRMFPNVNLTSSPWDASVEDFDRAGDDEFATMGVKTLEKHEATLLGVKAIAVTADWPIARGGHRTLQLQVVKGGQAVVLTCSGDPAAFEVVSAGCQTIAASLMAQ